MKIKTDRRSGRRRPQSVFSGQGIIRLSFRRRANCLGESNVSIRFYDVFVTSAARIGACNSLGTPRRVRVISLGPVKISGFRRSVGKSFDRALWGCGALSVVLFTRPFAFKYFLREDRLLQVQRDLIDENGETLCFCCSITAHMEESDTNLILVRLLCGGHFDIRLIAENNEFVFEVRVGDEHSTNKVRIAQTGATRRENDAGAGDFLYFFNN